MKILFLQSQPCIRALKYAYGIRHVSKETEISFAFLKKTLTEFYGSGDELFDKWIKLGKNVEETLEKIIQDVQIDLIHSHNAPDDLSVKAINVLRRTGKNIPLVHDTHDLVSIRQTPYGTCSPEEGLLNERLANEGSDGRIYVSQRMKEIAEKRYSINSMNLVFPSFISRDFIPFQEEEKLSMKDGEIHLVYEGNVDSVNKGSHYDLEEIFQKIAAQKINIHLYMAKENENYRRLAERNKFIHYHGHHKPRSLLKELTRYDFGWAGFNDSQNKLHLETVLPNKLIDYLSAGLPVISFPHPSLKRFIEENKVGIICEDINGLFDLLAGIDRKAIQEEVKRRKYDFCVEENITTVFDFYRQLISDKSKTRNLSGSFNVNHRNI